MKHRYSTNSKKQLPFRGSLRVVPDQASLGCALCLMSGDVVIARSPEAGEFGAPEQKQDRDNLEFIAELYNSYRKMGRMPVSAISQLNGKKLRMRQPTSGA